MAAIVEETPYDYNNTVEETVMALNQRIRSRRWLFLGLVGIGAIVAYKKLF